ncbi:phage minor capsid protein [Mitsuokella multacida]|jgi:hypothetical protein|uniref:phage minor capsid protein n=1 Tax=Mitsuokella multacida TaxID=52226 RepID=UPI003FA1F773
MHSLLSDAQAKRLIQLYDAAEKELLAECNRLLLKNPESYSLAWTRAIKDRVGQIRAQLLSGSRTWCEEAIPHSYLAGVARAEANGLLGPKIGGGFGSIHQQAVQVLAENAYSRMADVDQIIGRRIDDIFRSISLEAAKGSVIGYETTHQTAKRIRDRLAERGITGFVGQAGREWNMGRYAKVLAQETTNQAFRQGTINRLQESGHDLVIVSIHSGTCTKCARYQGKTFSLSGTDPRYPALEDAKAGGLFHVGCLHVLSLAPEEAERRISKLKSEFGGK